LVSKIKDKIARAKSLISIKTYKRPLVYVILTMVMINLIILTVAAFVALWIDDDYQTFIDAFANGSVKWMLTPNAILTITNPQTLALAVVVLITGLVLFSGTIIALTTNAIKDYIQKKNSGSGKIHLDQHIVILNWNSKVPELVSDLLYVESKEVTVMILADVDKALAEKMIVNAIDKAKRETDFIKMNVLVKKGDPLLKSDLEDITISHAKTILIMNPDQHQEIAHDMSKSDLSVIKIILSLGPIQFLYQPPIVVEIKHYETKEKILTLSRVVKSLSEHKIMPICFDKRLGQIIAQTIIEHKIEDVYLSMFSFQGSEVYMLKNKTFEECLKSHPYAIPLSQNGNNLYVLGLNHEVIHKRSNHTVEPKKLQMKSLKSKVNLDVYILGKNNKLKFILDAFKQYEMMHGSHFSAHWIEEENLVHLVKELNQSEKQSTILLLSDEHQDDDALDANVINHLIYIEGHLTNRNTHIIVELLNPKNDPIVKGFSIQNTIISNKIISLLLSKLALYKETAPFYENLLTITPNDHNEDTQSVSIQLASDLLKEKFPISFNSKKQLVESIYLALHSKMIAIGLYRQGQLTMFEGDMHRLEELTIQSDDQLVLIQI
jgi:hypothetical protein